MSTTQHGSPHAHLPYNPSPSLNMSMTAPHEDDELTHLLGTLSKPTTPLPLAQTTCCRVNAGSTS